MCTCVHSRLPEIVVRAIDFRERLIWLSAGAGEEDVFVNRANTYHGRELSST